VQCETTAVPVFNIVKYYWKWYYHVLLPRAGSGL